MNAAQPRFASLTYGGVPVPYAVSWSGEDETFVGTCPHIGALAICQREDRGSGKPRFGQPHFGRQREIITQHRCDLCAGPLRNRTKISLSHARTRANGATGFAILQVEPMLHFECAQISARHCPSLRRDLKSGAFEARIVYDYRIQVAISAPQFISEYVPDYIAAPDARIAAHAKIELLRYRPLDNARLRTLVKPEPASET